MAPAPAPRTKGAAGLPVRALPVAGPRRWWCSWLKKLFEQHSRQSSEVADAEADYDVFMKVQNHLLLDFENSKFATRL